MICILADILICLLPSDHAVDNVSVGHPNKMIYIFCTLYCLKITDYKFLQYYKSPAFHPKKKIVTLQHAPGNLKKKVRRSVCRSQNVGPVQTPL